MIRSDFCAFILTHKRPHDIPTYSEFRKYGYTGKIFLLVDDGDDTVNEYKKLYGEDVIIFSKREVDKNFDVGDNFSGYRGVVYARNTVFNIARSMGYKYFIQLDDDYRKGIYFRYNSLLKYGVWPVRSLDNVIEIMIDYLESGNFLSVCMSQAGDHIGGDSGKSGRNIRLLRKAMNTFICRTDNPFNVPGRLNEDVNLYTSLGSRGALFFTTSVVQVNQDVTQTTSGGMTEIYRDTGTYIKSFYSVMRSPGFVKISEIGTIHKRIHHRINWPHAVPRIIRESHKKAS